MTGLSDRQLFALRVAHKIEQENGRGHFFEALRVADVEWREALASGDDRRIERLRYSNAAVGWGRTLSLLTTELGLLRREFNGFMWTYCINHRGRAIINDADGEGDRIDTNSLVPRGRVRRDLDRDVRGRSLGRAASGGLEPLGTEHLRRADEARTTSRDRDGL